LVIKVKDVNHAIELAQDMTREKGAITCSAYTTDENVKKQIKREMGAVFAPVSFNFSGPVWVNLNVAFSDIHLTGGNPAGNAGFANPEFLQKRFVWVGHKEEVKPDNEG
jgi:acyl-CoA reductase-like NAD-dependent aldehyde dehydrogenase